MVLQSRILRWGRRWWLETEVINRMKPQKGNGDVVLSILNGNTDWETAINGFRYIGSQSMAFLYVLDASGQDSLLQ
ncbi:hypothetical protein PG990_008635 [Apiospora arundinis]